MKIYVLFFTLGLLLGLFCTFLRRTLPVDSSKPPASENSFMELKKKVDKSKIGFKRNYEGLVTHSNKLSAELAHTRASLTKAKQRSQALQVQVVSLVAEQKTNRTANSYTDSACDSLVREVENLLESNFKKDSLYETAITNLEDQLVTKSSIIALKDAQYQNLDSAFTKCISDQDLLLDQSKALVKQAKRANGKRKVLSVLLLLCSGAAVNHFIQR